MIAATGERFGGERMSVVDVLGLTSNSEPESISTFKVIYGSKLLVNDENCFLLWLNLSWLLTSLKYNHNMHIPTHPPPIFFSQLCPLGINVLELTYVLKEGGALTSAARNGCCCSSHS